MRFATTKTINYVKLLESMYYDVCGGSNAML